jgi:hypothetical protein
VNDDEARRIGQKNKNLASSDCLSTLVIAIVDCLPKRHAHLSQSVLPIVDLLFFN